MNTKQFTLVDSDHMKDVHYNTMDRTLHVRYQNGYEYLVHGVEPERHQEFMNSDSKGNYWHQIIKTNYAIERIK